MAARQVACPAISKIFNTGIPLSKPDTMPSHYPFLALALLFVYFTLHSALAATRVKAWFAGRLGRYYRLYRLLYNALAIVLLFFILRWMFGWPDDYLFAPAFWSRGSAFILLATGIGMSIAALRQYNLGEFTGLQQLRQRSAIADHSALNTTGLNAFVRHPLYLATVLMLTGFFCAFPKISALILLASVLLYLPFGIHFEEKKLRRQFGQAYLEYEKRVKRLIPGIW